MGVIYVIAEAEKLGYNGDHPDWCNLGQGMPERNPLMSANTCASVLEPRTQSLNGDLIVSRR